MYFLKNEHYYIGATKRTTTPKNKTVENKMYQVDIQSDIITSGIKLKFLYTKRTSTELINFSKYLVRGNFKKFVN